LIEREVTEVLQLSYSYSSTPEAMRLVKEFELNILSQDFNEDCQLKIEVKLRDKPGLLEKIKLLQVTGHDITFGL
jgi:hypothetical protein